MFDDTLICPHCNCEQLSHEPDDISSHMCYTQCEHCDRPFWYAVEVSRTYTAYIDDGQNNDSS